MVTSDNSKEDKESGEGRNKGSIDMGNPLVQDRMESPRVTITFPPTGDIPSWLLYLEQK